MIRFFKNAIGIAYSLYTLVLFFLGLPIIFILYLFLLPLSTAKQMRYVFRINRIWIKTWAQLSGITLEVGDTERLTPIKPTFFYPITAICST